MTGLDSVRIVLTTYINCPKCGKPFSLTYDSTGATWSQRNAPELAKNELREKCPDHSGNRWEFLTPGDDS
jgi:hypothetical protein